MTWSTGEVLTVGSSVSATTDTERTYMLLARIISGVVYAYLLGDPSLLEKQLIARWLLVVVTASAAELATFPLY